MKFLKLFVAPILFTSIVSADSKTSEEKHQVFFDASASETVRGPSEFFTGDVLVTPIFPSNDVARYTAGKVTFAPGARSAWHVHPKGQHLIVLDGIGWTQEVGGKKIYARAGDALWCPPGVKHWHGATNTTSMTHFALTGVDDVEGNVIWMEKVTDEEYLSE